ncbi:MAG: hypothetical protein JEZ06_08805 [Anaerolineaceae bacterium]|nr:hypothetical protein [Anaerolineaceae bacterium]
MTKTQLQALIQFKVSVDEPDEFTAFLGLQRGRGYSAGSNRRKIVRSDKHSALGAMLIGPDRVIS